MAIVLSEKFKEQSQSLYTVNVSVRRGEPLVTLQVEKGTTYDQVMEMAYAQLKNSGETKKLEQLQRRYEKPGDKAYFATVNRSGQIPAQVSRMTTVEEIVKKYGNGNQAVELEPKRIVISA
jgi:hypothetical protein